MKIHWVLERLGIRGEFHKWPLERKRCELMAAGIHAVLCTTRRDDDLDTLLGNRYEFLQFPDGGSVPVAKANEAAGCVLAWLHAGLRVLVHCRAGRNRSGLVAALVVRHELRVSGREAVAIVRQARPGALANPVFEEYLNTLQPPVTVRQAVRHS